VDPRADGQRVTAPHAKIQPVEDLHDLREVKFSNEGEGLWRRAWSQKLNGNLYPTHGLGPVAQCLNANRGDAFDFLVRLGMMSRFDVAALGHNTTPFLHRFAEVTKHGFSVRLRYAGDPDVAPPPLRRLLSERY
jgi:hypothetical protein